MSNERFNLDACPFCGCECAEMIPVQIGTKTEYFIRCGQCRAMTKMFEIESAAATAWNRRAKPKS